MRETPLSVLAHDGFDVVGRIKHLVALRPITNF